jgi:hypothetical protein
LFYALLTWMYLPKTGVDSDNEVLDFYVHFSSNLTVSFASTYKGIIIEIYAINHCKALYLGNLQTK